MNLTLMLLFDLDVAVCSALNEFDLDVAVYSALNEFILSQSQAMYEKMPVDCTYQRNMFPGLIYRSPSCPVVVLCFFSRKVVLTGGKTVSDIIKGWHIIWNISRQFIK